jgi:hypothetical protein
MTPPPAIAIATHQRAANTLESGRVARYHAAPSVAPQTVGLHSWGVAVLAVYITGGAPSAALLQQAIMHDAAEIFIGDVPFTVKRDHPEVKRRFRELEIHIHDFLVMGAVSLDPHDEAVLKVCDTLEGLIWCRKTEVAGNGFVTGRWVQALDYALKKFGSPTIDPENDRTIPAALFQQEVNRAHLLADAWAPTT